MAEAPDYWRYGAPGPTAQAEFWEKAALSAIAALARRNDLPAEEKAEQAARIADRLTKQWLRRRMERAETHEEVAACST